jgi:hypothetical protein
MEKITVAPQDFAGHRRLRLLAPAEEPHRQEYQADDQADLEQQAEERPSPARRWAIPASLGRRSRGGASAAASSPACSGPACSAR